MGTPATAINTSVTPTRPNVYYCDPGDIQRRLSTEGTELHLKDFGPGSLAGESGAIEDCIWDASEIINSFVTHLYRPEDLVTSAYINRRCTDMAVYYLMTRRGNSAPGSIQRRYEECLDWLQKIHDQKLEIPMLPVRHTQAPAFSNVRIDMRYPTHRVRVERSISEKTPTMYPQSVDMQAEYDYSI